MNAPPKSDPTTREVSGRRGASVAAGALVVALMFVADDQAATRPPPAVLQISDLAAQAPPGDSLEHLDAFGTAVAVIGDVDGNGAADVAVGAPNDDDGGPERGAVYVLLLDSAATVVSGTKIASSSGGFPVALEDEDLFGSAVSGIGDVDDDGVPDLAVGVVRKSDALRGTGAMWILTLDVGGGVESSHEISASTPGMEGALAEWDSFGSSIARLANGPGGAIRLAVGARSDDGSGFDRGAVWVLTLNSAFGVVSRTKIDDSAPELAGKLENRGWFGASLASDGALLAVGASGDDSSFAAQGSVWLLTLAGDGSIGTAHEIAAEMPQDRFGRSVGFFGDLDFDGVRDLVVGRPRKRDFPEDRRGAFDVLLMNVDATVRERRTYPANTQWPWNEPDADGRVGTSVAVLGDLDGNWIPEVLTGGPENPPGGSAYIFYLNGISASNATCGDPTGDGETLASDALLVLQTAIGTAFCELRYCDVDNSGGIRATDALLVLASATSTPVVLSCPTTTTSTSTTLIIIDECFSDEDCVSYGDPELQCCCFFECCACEDFSR
jgi:hypothetical protein